MLSVVILNVVKLSVVMLIAIGPIEQNKCKDKSDTYERKYSFIAFESVIQ
jgi:hypothetical protein